MDRAETNERSGVEAVNPEVAPGSAQGKGGALSRLLVLASLVLLVFIYFTPVWWVSLTAPNYPEEAFPDGVRINFHMNGVFNGCQKVEKSEIQEEEALDCVHEMDTINHYVGMYPIAAGGVLERAFSPFLFVMLGMMLIGFACSRPRIRVVILGIGFGATAVWMGLTFYGAGGLKWQSEGYVTAMVSALDQDTSVESSSSGGGILEQMCASLKESADRGEAIDIPDACNPKQETISSKEGLINNLRVTFEKSQERKPLAERLEWSGSGQQMLTWHYGVSLGRYFNDQSQIRPMVKNMGVAFHVVFWGLIGAMLLLIFGARKNRGLFFWLLAGVPALLPLFFIIDYSAWLWWYGHNLNAMGAFTVKPFMPTVFGVGKVAQFSTFSYPNLGFGLMVLSSLLLGLAMMFRRKALGSSRDS